MVENIALLFKQIKESNDIFQKFRLLEYLMREKNLRVIDLAKTTEYSSSYICHLLRLKKVPEAIVDGYYSKSISSSHIFILSRLNDKGQMIDLYEKILGDNFTVKQTENEVRNYLYQVKSIGKYIHKDDQGTLKKKVKEKYPEVDMEISQTRIKGKITLEIKGDLEKSSKNINQLIDKLIS
jgi:hypothetical protein